MKRSVVARTAAGAVGGLMLVGVGSAALAAFPDAEDSSDVNVNVEIAAQGALTMTVDGDSSTLTEDGSTDDFRQFTGVLPDVTVTDDRDAVPDGVYWYVVGQAGDFLGNDGQDPITPDHLGWAPAMVTEGDGEVTEGEPVGTVIDGGDIEGDPLGLVGQEMLQLAMDSAEAKAANGSWTANADLILQTETDVAPGSYTSVLTLSLFEEEY